MVRLSLSGKLSDFFHLVEKLIRLKGGCGQNMPYATFLCFFVDVAFVEKLIKSWRCNKNVIIKCYKIPKNHHKNPLINNL